jgi:hypothetical protein
MTYDDVLNSILGYVITVALSLGAAFTAKTSIDQSEVLPKTWVDVFVPYIIAAAVASVLPLLVWYENGTDVRTLQGRIFIPREDRTERSLYFFLLILIPLWAGILVGQVQRKKRLSSE